MKKKPLASKVLVQTFGTCTFVAHVDDSEELLVRLESSGSRLPAVLALRRLAALVIPELVPKTLQTGKAKTKDGIELQYCVTEFLGNTVVLESVWDHLDDEQQLTIMDSVVRAMRKLQTLGLNDLSVRSILKERSTFRRMRGWVVRIWVILRILQAFSRDILRLLIPSSLLLPWRTMRPATESSSNRHIQIYHRSTSLERSLNPSSVRPSSATTISNRATSWFANKIQQTANSTTNLLQASTGN